MYEPLTGSINTAPVADGDEGPSEKKAFCISVFTMILSIPAIVGA
jgi:hypothetical protein